MPHKNILVKNPTSDSSHFSNSFALLNPTPKYSFNMLFKRLAVAAGGSWNFSFVWSGHRLHGVECGAEILNLNAMEGSAVAGHRERTFKPLNCYSGWAGTDP